jgi:hypothetical protein
LKEGVIGGVRLLSTPFQPPPPPLAFALKNILCLLALCRPAPVRERLQAL